ncbi:glycosyltransferase family 87 protein [Specibacter sp. NPDC057265]|uniref:glycosyltransferase family 87 protein n=1 Tax=Specibacter sp. NPDC057265 TaxID=3346075 RepID=UPI00362AD3E9
MQDSHVPGTPPRQPLVVPSRSDALLRRLTEPAGGPMGRRTAPGRTDPGFFTVERVLVIMTAFAALLAVMAKGHCRTTGWNTPDQQSTVCWSMFPNAYVEHRLDVVFPFFGQGSNFDQSVVAGSVAGATAWLTRSSGEGALRQLAFFDLNAALIAVLWIAVVILLARSAGRRPWDAAIVAVSPVLILTAFASWEMWAVALAVLGLYLFVRMRTLWAGVFFGLSALASPFGAVVLVALLFLGFRTGRATRMLEMLAAAILAWVLALAPLMARNPPAFPLYIRGLFAAEASDSSLYGGWNLVAGRMALPLLGPAAATAVAVVLVLAVLAGVACLALYTPRTPRVAQLVFLAVAGCQLVGKDAQPWHAVWLVPLVALALPRWRPVLLWQVALVAHFIALMLFQSKVLGGISNQHAIDTPYFVISALVAGCATGALMVLVIRDMFAPAHDVMRRGGVEDPQAGALQGPPSDPRHALVSQSRETKHQRIQAPAGIGGRPA